MIRSYDLGRPVPAEVIDRIVGNGLRAPSAGFSQGWGFLVLDTPADVARFRDAVRPRDHPGDWFAAGVNAPLLTAVDAGLGACFFGIPAGRIGAYRAAFGVPARFTPIGAISVGYSDEPARDLSSRRKPEGRDGPPGPVDPAGQLKSPRRLGS